MLCGLSMKVPSLLLREGGGCTEKGLSKEGGTKKKGLHKEEVK
jgi:hypothetical protein